MISILDLFKIGIGPSSSHTVGPMRAARRFLRELKDERLLSVRSIRVELYGSLALTGKGHGTDRAILLGLSGEEPDHVDPATAATVLSKMQEQGVIQLLGMHTVKFDPRTDLLFHSGDTISAGAKIDRITPRKRREAAG